MQKFDFIAIGGGNAGISAANHIAAAGKKVALIDKGAIGGLCSLNGCNPKKVLVRSSEVLDEARHAARFGVHTGNVSIDWSQVIDRKETFTDGVTESYEKSLPASGITLIKGAPRFTGPQTLEVRGEIYEADGFVIATGSTPTELTFPGAELAIISDEVLAEREVPQRMLIIGAGVIGFEFGQIFSRAGAQVTLLAIGGRALEGNEEAIVDELVEFSSAFGMNILTHAQVKSMQHDGQSIIVDVEVNGAVQQIAADCVVNAAGRTPSLAGLDLEKAGVNVTRRGVEVNDFLRSANPRIFAAGDAHGKFQLSPVASYEGRLVGRNFMENDVEKIDYNVLPRCIFSVPAFASVGLTESQANERGLKFKAYMNEMEGWKVFAIAGEQVACAKILVEEGSGHILGAHLLHQAAGDQVHFFALAMKYGIPAHELKNLHFAYPTFSSAIPYMLG